MDVPFKLFRDTYLNENKPVSTNPKLGPDANFRQYAATVVVLFMTDADTDADATDVRNHVQDFAQGKPNNSVVVFSVATGYRGGTGSPGFNGDRTQTTQEKNNAVREALTFPAAIVSKIKKANAGGEDYAGTNWSVGTDLLFDPAQSRGKQYVADVAHWRYPWLVFEVVTSMVH